MRLGREKRDSGYKRIEQPHHVDLDDKLPESLRGGFDDNEYRRRFASISKPVVFIAGGGFGTLVLLDHRDA